MANDGTVKIGTELDQSGFKSGLSGLGSFASKGFGAVGSAAKAMASVTVGALAAVGTGMGAMVVQGVKYNAQMENFTASFATMLGSQEAAIEKVAELKKMGASTPFEMGDLATATTTLLQYGIAADSSKDILTTLGDISLGNAEKLQGLTAVYGKMNSTGKLTGETLEGMVSNGFNPLNIISAKTGESMEQLRERMKDGGISADEVAAAFKSATSAGGQFYKGMETASVTFDGLISTLKDNANSLVGDVVKPISESLSKTLLPEAIGMIGELTAAFEKKGIPGLIDAAGSVVGKIIQKIVSGAPKVIQMANSFLQQLLNALIEQLPALSEAAVGIMTGLADALIANMPLLFELGITLFTNLITGIAAALPQLIPAMQNAILTMTQTLMENLPLILAAGMQILLSIIQGIAEMLPELVSYLPTLITTIVNILIENLPAIIDAAILILLALVQGLTDAIPALVEMLPTIIETIINTLMDNLPAIIEAGLELLVALINGLVIAIPRLIKMLPTIISTIVKVLMDNLPMIIQAAVDIIMALIIGLISAIPDLVMMMPDIINAIKDAFINFDWKTLGKDIIDGIKNGIKNAAGSLASAAKEAADKAIQGVKDFLGIKSPSKKAKEEIGKQIPAGAAAGVDANAYMLADSAVDASDSAAKAMRSAAAQQMADEMRGLALRRSSELGAGTQAPLVAASDYWNKISAQRSGSGKTGPETIVMPVYIGDQLLEEYVATASENYQIKKNR